MYRVVSHYEIKEKLGEGGMAVVYKGIDTRLLRPVALKILSSTLVAEKKHQERFIFEAQTASSLNHPNICTIYDIGEYKDILYIVMEYVEGETLGQMLARCGALPEKQVVDVAKQICAALSTAHSKGIIHRDVKPGNIMTSANSSVKVMDFGLAKLAGIASQTMSFSQNDGLAGLNDAPYLSQWRPTNLTLSLSNLLGTASYMSPEQADNLDIDHRSDIFSFGIVLYEMLTTHLPFDGPNITAVLHSIVENQAIPIDKYRTNVSPQMSDIIQKCLQNKREQRYQQMDNIIEDLNQLAGSASSHPLPGDYKTKKRRKSLFIIPSALSLFVLILTLLLAHSWPFQSGSLLREQLNSVAILKELEKDKFVIAVAPFWGNDEAASQEGRVMQALIEQKISSELAESNDLVVIGKDKVNVLRSHDEAREFGKSVGAYAVFWGQVISLRGEISSQPHVTSIEPHTRRDYYDPNVFSISLDQPNQIDRRKSKIDELKNTILMVAAMYYYYKERTISSGDRTLIEKSIQLCERIIPPSEKSLYWLGINYVVLGKHENAKSAFKEALLLNPDLDAAWGSLGYSCMITNDFEQSLRYFKKADSLLPENPWYQISIGRVYRHLQQFDLAIAYNRKSIELDPVYYKAYFELGAVYFDMGNYRDATIFYEQAINKGYVVNGDNLYILGTAYHYWGKYDKALENYFKVLEQDSSYHWAWANHNIGLVYQHLGKYKKAVDHFQKAVELESERIDHTNGLGAVFLSTGDYEKAIECFYKSILFDPDNQYSYLLYYLALFRSGKPQQAQIILKDFAANLKNEDWIAPVIHYYNGNVDEKAVLKDAWFASVEFDKGRKCEAFYYLGMAYLLKIRPEMKNDPNDLEKALDYFKKSVETNKQDYMEYELAWAELKRLSGEAEM